jgi:hypothetical protein
VCIYRGWLAFAVGWTRNLVVAASLHCNSKCCLVPLKTIIDVTPGLNISFSSNVHKASFMLVVISQVLWSENLVPIKIQSNPQSWTDYFWSCSQPCELKQMLPLSMHDIACAFGKLGYTNLHSHENSVLLLYLSCWWCCYPIAKGATMEPRASCVLQPHDCY